MIKTLIYPKHTENYPRVSAILKATQSASKSHALQMWAASLGTKEAERQSEQARDRGTAFHDQAEKASHGETEGISESILALFEKLKIKTLGTELAVWSDTMKYRGRLDNLFQTEDGVVGILDYKTSKKKRDKSFYADARAQIGGYALAVEETYKVTPTIAMVIVAVPDASKDTPFESFDLWEFQIFELSASDLNRSKKRFESKVTEYYNPTPKPEKKKREAVKAPLNPFA